MCPKHFVWSCSWYRDWSYPNKSSCFGSLGLPIWLGEWQLTAGWSRQSSPQQGDLHILKKMIKCCCCGVQLVQIRLGIWWRCSRSGEHCWWARYICSAFVSGLWELFRLLHEKFALAYKILESIIFPYFPSFNSSLIHLLIHLLI